MTSVAPDRRAKARDGDPELRGRRSEPRAYVVVPASAEALTGRRHVKILDVSRTGARLEGNDLPGVGRDIILACTGFDTFGTIAWSASGRCGMQFDEPISGGDLLALRLLSATLGESDMTADERQAAADWANGLAR